MSHLQFDYIRDPMAIYQASFKAIRAETDLRRLPEALHGVALRVVHAAANPDIVDLLDWSEGAAEAGIKALKNGATVLTDAEMVSHGIIRRKLPAENAVMCCLKMPGVPGTAKRLNTTRSAAAVENWKPWVEGSVVAVGNAPTTLFHLLERISEGWPKPALILGFPVGFIGAAESKRALADHAAELGVPYVTLHGRLGGSAMAAAAVNALAGGNEE
ncbi:precorrin-8X methylmutase [Aestuariispira ectoiniformans]|uniref:precorrin-8X methylmutase n=1 Tax=Aestuariispira ectoiniformans TaxID=2775080 RepID=UPI00223B96B4|nr:precorrin-8X methylmutase [Aestuariispira ectoiniformans]